jgi:hypothetical protein
VGIGRGGTVLIGVVIVRERWGGKDRRRGKIEPHRGLSWTLWGEGRVPGRWGMTGAGIIGMEKRLSRLRLELLRLRLRMVRSTLGWG